MKTQEQPLPTQSKYPASILDATPFELAEIDAYQDRNRGFKDEGEEYYEHDFSGGDEW